MTTIEMTSQEPGLLDVEVLVLAAFRTGPDGSTPTVLTEGVHCPGLDLEALAALLPTVGFDAALDEVVRLPAAVLPSGPRAGTVLVVGTGDQMARARATADNDVAALGATIPGVLRRAAGRAARALAGTGSAAFLLPAGDPQDLEAVAQGVMLGAYSWSARRPAPTAPLGRAVIVAGCEAQEAGRTALEGARVLGEATALVRDLVNEPPNRLPPATFAEQALAQARRAGLDAEVLDERALSAQGFGGILGVGQGSAHPPRLVRLEWAPPGAARHVAMIGKGITFDSGGLSLKPPASMPEMKSDMAGAATVLGAVLAAARLNLPVRVTAWLAMAENMPGGSAQRPSDIVTMYDGTTVEITNTDAEGRLVMADALARAVQEGPDAVVDVATLTGAQIVALGERVAGVMGTPALRDAVVQAAVAAGESFWAMPLPEDLRQGLDSPYAHRRNAATGKSIGGMLSAGLFLREFVGSTPWAHLDIAGPSYNDGSPWGLTPTGGTGAGVATLVELLRRQGA